MSGDVWCMDPNLIFTGSITKRERYRGRGKGRKMVDGYLVPWSDGNRENWPYESLLPCLIPCVSGKDQSSDGGLVSKMRASTLGVSVDDSKTIDIDISGDPEADEYGGLYISDSGDDMEQIVPDDI